MEGENGKRREGYEEFPDAQFDVSIDVLDIRKRQEAADLRELFLEKGLR